MADFLQLLDVMEGAEASPARLFETDAGRKRRLMDDPVWREKLVRATEMIESIARGRMRTSALQEAFGTSDFSALNTNILQWKTIAAYQAWPTIYRQYTNIATVPDFRSVKASVLDGMQQELPVVPASGEYPQRAPVQRDYTYKVEKHGAAFSIEWEAYVNDFLRLFDNLPPRLAQAARNSEELAAARFLVPAVSGTPNTALFGSTMGTAWTPTGDVYSVLNSGTGKLNVTNLGTAVQAFNQMTDGQSAQPIMARPRYLIVPPALEITARQIIKSGELFSLGGAGATAVAAGVLNIVAEYGLEVVVNPWLSSALVNTGGNANTQWFLAADQSTGSSFEFGFLLGHTEPELFQKIPNAMYVGGGMVPSQDGSFETDTIDYKVRHVFGGTVMNPRYIYCSNGTV